MYGGHQPGYQAGQLYTMLGKVKQFNRRQPEQQVGVCADGRMPARCLQLSRCHFPETRALTLLCCQYKGCSHITTRTSSAMTQESLQDFEGQGEDDATDCSSGSVPVDKVSRSCEGFCFDGAMPQLCPELVRSIFLFSLWCLRGSF
eukprot:TRINITY_DN1586_c0_g1_i1.p1 TRINITY_DN1586_c0_g1~~TRINITY_DN1586_c0_g1_i1.p1  ORF type:complete len:146 (-),score=2.88 TRINITY_DN1586_c0_g1_i1:438-875(-)